MIQKTRLNKYEVKFEVSITTLISLLSYVIPTLRGLRCLIYEIN